jgi:membrane protein implicated in regulation of membrane protease activity
MAEIIEDIQEYIRIAKQYVDVKLEIIKSQGKITISALVSTMATGLMVATLIGISLVIFTLGLAYAAGEWLGSTAKGFFLVGGIFLVLSILLFLLSKSFLKKYIQNEIIRKLDEDI